MRCATATATAIACLGVLVLAPPSLAAPPKPLGLDCKDQNGVRFCQGDGSAQRVASWDGVPLDADVTLPPASQGDGPFPAIAMLHGYGGSKADFETDTIDGGKKQADGSVKTDTRFHHWNNVWFAQRGYVVLNYTARGFGKSCGSQDSRTPDCFQNVQNQDPSSAGWLHLKDRRREAHDTQFLLGKLVDEGLVKPKELAATGISYGGGESIELAYLKDRVQKVSDSPTDFEPWVSPEKKIPMSLAAAFPRWPWSDLVSALTPNGRFLDFDASTADKSRFPPGIPIQSYIAGLYALGNTSGFYAPPGVDMTADVSTWNARVAAGDPYTDPSAQMILDQIFSFHQGFGTPASTPAPLIIENGWTDDLFPPAEALRVYNSLRATNPDAKVALQFGDLGHSRGSNKANTDSAFNEMASAWIDHYTTGSETQQPPAPGSVVTFTQTCPKAKDGAGPYAAPSWPELHRSAVRFAFADPQTVMSGGGNPQTAKAFDPIAGTTDACSQVADETAPGTAVYRLPKSDGFTMLGLPTVTATITTTGVNGQLDSRLWDVAPDGQQTLITRGAYRLEDNQAGRITFQLHGNGWEFAAGHVPKLELLGQDAPYLRPGNGAFQVEVKDLVVELPALEKPVSQAEFGQGVQPVLGGGGTVTPSAVSKPKLSVSVTPHRARAGRRTRFLFRVRAVSPSDGKARLVRGARLVFAGKHYRTGKLGGVRFFKRLRHAGRRTARASKPGYRGGSVRVRVLPARRARH